MMCEYVSNVVFADDEGLLSREAENAQLDKKFVDEFLRGDNWDTFDYHDKLVEVIRVKRGTLNPLGMRNTTWPNGVFRDYTLLQEVRDLLDRLFSAIGYRARSSTGVWGCMNKIIAFVKTYGDYAAHPEAALYDCFQQFMRVAQSLYVAAKEASAAAPFPSFRDPTLEPTWLKRIEGLTEAAQRRVADRDLYGTT